MTHTCTPWLVRLLALSRRGGWGILLWLLWLLPAQAIELRVAVNNNSQIQVGTSTTGVIRDSRGQALLQLPELQPITVDEVGGRLALINDRSNLGESSSYWLEPSGDGVVWIGDRWYRGKVLLMPTESGVKAINYVNIDDYLYSVVGSEMPTSWPQEA